MAFSSLPSTIDGTKRDFDGYKQGILDYLQVTQPTNFTDYTESQPVMAVIEAIAWGMANNAFYLDRAANEPYFATAKQRRNIILLARNNAYKPALATAASVNLQIDTSTLQVQTGDVFSIVSGTSFSASGGISFETVGDHVIVCTNGPSKLFSVDGGATTDTPEFSVSQGDSKSDTFVGTGDPFQEFTLSQFPAIADSIQVYAGGLPSDPGASLWTEAESLVLGDPNNVDNQEIYEVLIDENDQATIRTGDDNTGAIIGEGVTLYVSYRTGGGSTGNVATGAIDANVAAVKNGATQVSLHVSNSTPASGGEDRESIDSIRFFAPLNVKVNSTTATLNDYFIVSNGFTDGSTGSIAKAGVICEPIDGLKNLVTVYVWAADNDNNLVEGVSSSLMASLKAELDETKILCTYNMVVEGTNVPVNLQVLIQVDPRFLESTVKTQVEEVVTNIFREDRVRFGNELRLSWVYEEIMDIPGVKWAEVTAPNCVVDSGTAQEIATGTLPSQGGASVNEFIMPSTFTSGVFAGTSSIVAGYYANYRVEITSGTGVGQTRRITAYAYDDGSLHKTRVDSNWVVRPDATSVMRLWHPRRIPLDPGASAVQGFYIHRPIAIVGGPGINQTRTIIGYDATTKIATIDKPWTNSVTGASLYKVLADLKCTQREALVNGTNTVVTVISNLDES